MTWNSLIYIAGIVRKWLDALKGESFNAETFDYFLESFKGMLTPNLSADAMRSLALYITYATYKPRSKVSVPLRAKSVKLKTEMAPRRRTLGSSSNVAGTQLENGHNLLSEEHVALKILELYTDCLCRKDDLSNILRFARTVTNKVGPQTAYIHAP